MAKKIKSILYKTNLKNKNFLIKKLQKMVIRRDEKFYIVSIF